jgi:hypothetical protein
MTPLNRCSHRGRTSVLPQRELRFINKTEKRMKQNRMARTERVENNKHAVIGPFDRTRWRRKQRWKANGTRGQKGGDITLHLDNLTKEQ